MGRGGGGRSPSAELYLVQSNRAGRWDFMAGDDDRVETESQKIKLPLLQYPPQTARFSRILHTSSRARVGPRKKWISLLTVQRATGPMSLFIEAFKLQNNPEITRTCLRGLGGFDSRKVSPVLTSGLSYSGLLSRTVFSSYFPRTSTINPK